MVLKESRFPKRKKRWDGCRGCDECRQRQLATCTWSDVGVTHTIQNNGLRGKRKIHLIKYVHIAFVEAGGLWGVLFHCSFVVPLTGLQKAAAASPLRLQDITSYSAKYDLISLGRWGHAEQMLLKPVPSNKASLFKGDKLFTCFKFIEWENSKYKTLITLMHVYKYLYNVNIKCIYTTAVFIQRYNSIPSHRAWQDRALIHMQCRDSYLYIVCLGGERQ